MNKFFFLSFAIILFSCQSSEEKAKINGDTIRAHMAELSADAYEGRMPCSKGDTMTIDYLVNSLKEIGLKPGNGDSYTQEVPLVSIDSKPTDTMTIEFPDTSLVLQSGSDFVVHTQRNTDAISLEDSELVFCGYGIVDESLGWNDYEGMDMKGKTAVVLVNDPGFGGEDRDFFRGDIMTYYGRWTYKYEEADRQGADGILIIHETSSAGYPWFVVQSSWSGPQQQLAGIDRSNDCGVKGWISLDQARALFAGAGWDFTEEIKNARKPGFKPKPMNATVSVGLTTEREECVSRNVIAIKEGSTYPEEYIVYTAHWDHIGVGRPVEGDSIYNGALDNASGTSLLLSIAEAFAKSKTERSVVFLFVTAEEQGLLGSEYYVKNAIYPLTGTVANINIDGVNPAGRMKDFTITGIGHSEMDEYAERAAERQGRYIMEEPEPEKGYFFRSDHFNFAKAGVPALYAEGGYDHEEKGKEYAMDIKKNYVAERYHAPADEFNPEEWDMEGMIQEGEIYYDIGKELADSRDWPEWYEESEFERSNAELLE